MGNTIADLNAAKTHCPQDHPLSGDNVYVDGAGKRHCRTCRRERSRAANPKARTAGRRGTAVERKPGVWLIQATHPDGSKVSKTIHVPTRPGTTPFEVQRQLAALVAEVDADNETGRSKTILFRTVAARWLEKAELAASTRYNYVHYLDGRVLPRLGDMKVGHINVKTLEDFYADLRREGLKPATIRQIHAIVRNVLGCAARWGYTPSNVAVSAKPGGSGHAHLEIEAPSQNDVARLLAACGDDIEMRTALVLSVALGTRRGELAAIRWSNVDLEAGSVRIEAAITEIRGQGIVMKGTKTSATATLSIGDNVVTELRRYRDWCDRRASEAGVTIIDQAFLFSHLPRMDFPWLPGYLTSRFTHLRESAGVATQFKNLRHFHATQLIANGTDVRTVAGRLRHASPSTTLQFYAKFDRSADRKAAQMFDTIVPLTPPAPDGTDGM